MTVHLKSYPARIKADTTSSDNSGDDTTSNGRFEAIVSAFGNVDTYGDVVLPGAFSDDLERWAKSGDPIPVIWSHDWGDPFSHLGSVLKAEEREDGLWIEGQIHDIDTNPKAAQVYQLLKDRRVTQFSFAYDVLDAGWGERDGEDIYELRKLAIYEVGPCLVGVNQETELLAVKAAREIASKAGRIVAAAGDTNAMNTAAVALADAVENFKNVLALTATSTASTAPDPVPEPEPGAGEETGDDGAGDEPDEEDQEPAAAPAKDEEPMGAKSEEPAPANALAAPENRLRILALAGKEGAHDGTP